MSSETKTDSFAAMFEQESARAVPKRRTLRVGDRLEAVVVKVGRDTVFVELDGKQQAFLDANELRGPDGTLTVAEGDRVSAHVVEVDDEEGVVRLGRSLGKGGSVAALEQAKAAGLALEGKVTGVNKGGLEVDFSGTRAFCPISQADDHFMEDPSVLIGQTLRFLVSEVRDGGKNVVVSRRALLQREASESAERVMSAIVPGAVMKGKVTAVRDFGAFVDLGGIEGLLPRSEIGFDRSVAVAEALKPGDAVEVLVREVKEIEPTRRGAPTRKITLSLKALMADPWAELDLAEGRVVLGKVVRVTEFGRFVRIAAGVEGLLHVSELGSKVKADEGDELTVVVKKIDRDTKKISLVPAPDGAAVGTTVTSQVPVVGAVVRGAVERHETYGLFLQVEGTKGRAGRGLVPNAELGVPRGTDLRKAFPVGTVVAAKVLETGDGKLRLSIKGALDAEERAEFEAARGRQIVPSSLGTFADLLKAKKL
ncbi:MAG: S1 RNA-binding domain-containing protein [Polyangiaceae bacterium]|nr:S1 RNA-binding domain-containing protein [Polyangiaceae bacterium]